MKSVQIIENQQDYNQWELYPLIFRLDRIQKNNVAGGWGGDQLNGHSNLSCVGLRWAVTIDKADDIALAILIGLIRSENY